VAWTATGAAAGLALGAVSRSVSLSAFGLDSAIELLCAGILLRRLAHEQAAEDGHAHQAELRAARVVGALLLVAAVYITAQAGWHLWLRTAPTFNVWGVVLTGLTIPIMAVLGRRKLELGAALGSRALHADAIGNVVCWYLAALVLISLLLDRALHWWWLDAVASLAIVALLVREGVAAWRGTPL